jgi:predicted small lipoprotein YifL
MTLIRAVPASLLAMSLAACGGGGPAVPPSAPSASASAPVSAPGDLAQASFAGFGTMRFGMDEAAFRRAWGGELMSRPPAPGSTCTYFYPVWSKAPPELAFMFEQGRFVRYDVTGSKEIAPGGGTVGMSRDELMRRYRRQGEEQPDKYQSGASTYRVRGDGDAAVVFEIGTEGIVKKWRVGVPPQVDYVEGCG